MNIYKLIDNKTFDENKFNKDLKSTPDSIERLDDPLFESIFIDVLNTHVPVTTKTMQTNNHQFTTKALRKAKMTRSRLKTAYLKTGKTTTGKKLGKLQERKKRLHKFTQKKVNTSVILMQKT